MWRRRTIRDLDSNLASIIYSAIRSDKWRVLRMNRIKPGVEGGAWVIV